MTAHDLPALPEPDYQAGQFGMLGENCYSADAVRKIVAARDAEIARLTSALKTANSNHEHFEREWYLRGDELARLRAALAAQQPAAVPAGWQYRWTNPGDCPDIAPEDIEWKEVKPASPLQSMEMRLQELRSYTFRDRPAYEVRALYVADPTRQPLTLEYIDQHIGADEGDREAVIALVREVERAHNIGALAAAPAVQPSYVDSTPHLNVGNSAFESWFQAQPFATQSGIKQMCRDSYAAGMGDPLVCAKEQPAEAVAPSVREAAQAALEALKSARAKAWPFPIGGHLDKVTDDLSAALAAPTAAPSA